ncbi:MAG: saccharopine dehydrogenase NADP-binding domain-containing protein [Nostoc sp.]|uniref:saccharopine dehydrogenase family protein n=1 Tax=Nostoc sp. TaxID=1180 RepID=UPI002FF8713A
MNKITKIGVIGGYGATGSVVVNELLKQTENQLIIGGRNIDKAQQFSEKKGQRVLAKYVDVYDDKSLAEFCQDCGIIINCTGPGYHILDRVAQAAFKHKCHYIDTSGEEKVLESLSHHQDEMKTLGLTFLLSAGWMPGLSEVMPIYADMLAEKEFDSVESLDLYFADASKWSMTGTIDQLEFIYQNRNGVSLDFSNYVKNWKSKNVAIKSSQFVTLPNPLGIQKVYLYYFENLKKFTAKKSYPVKSYIAWLNWKTFITVLYIKFFLKRNQEKAAKTFRKLYEKTNKVRGGNGGFIVVIVKGKKQNKIQNLIVTLFERRHYWLTGIVPAIAARMLLENQISTTGCHYLGDAVNATDFMAEIAKSGIKYDVFFENDN